MKLVQTNQRVLFDGQDDLITSYRLEAKDIFDRQLPKNKRTRRVNLDEEPRRELDHHKAHLPMYQGDRKESKKLICLKSESQKRRPSLSQRLIQEMAVAQHRFRLNLFLLP